MQECSTATRRFKEVKELRGSGCDGGRETLGLGVELNVEGGSREFKIRDNIIGELYGEGNGRMK